jgi:molecular chaperone GrpE
METVNSTAEKPVSPETETSTPREASASTQGSIADAEREQFAKEKLELQELLQRRQAEFENYRKRVEREKAELFEFASMDAIKAILPILDDLERALKVESADKEYARGMELIYQRFTESLKKQGLEPLAAKGSLFDAHLHSAVDMVETDEHPDQTILDEYQKGYFFKGKLLRPAMVKVAVKR